MMYKSANHKAVFLNLHRYAEAVKKKGLSVLRVRVRQDSHLIGKTPAEIDFRKTYGGAVQVESS